MNNNQLHKIPQAAIDAADRLINRVIADRKKQMALDRLEEDTAVNMSPYKDSIKNAETPKSKQAKNKINDLFRK
jgi:hypothetical protein